MKFALRSEGGEDAPAAVRIVGLRKTHRGRSILDSLDLRVTKGAIYLLVGPNGSGKTTTLRIIQGLVRPEAGHCRVFDLDPLADGPRVRADIGYMAERTDWGVGWLRIRDMFDIASDNYPAWDASYATHLGDRLRLDRRRTYKSCSKGEARRVQMVLALAHRPSLLLLDEPTDGLDPLVRATVLSLLAEHIAETECSAIVSTHLVMEFDGLADHIGAMRDGKLLLEASVDQLSARLRRYRAQVPSGWQGAPDLGEHVLRRATTDREIDWTIWGMPDSVRESLKRSGARIDDERPVGLEEAAIALLGSGTESPQ